MMERLPRAALLPLALLAAFALNTTAIAQVPPGTIWYNGDWNGLNGLANERNTAVTQAAVYEDFNVTSPGWNVTALFSDNLTNTVITGADWEIRTGLSEGNAGTLVASGTTNSPIVTPTGRGGQLFEYMVEVTGLSLFLPMLPSGQHYWLNVTPVGNGSGRSFNSTTSGMNCVGTPCGNDQNAFFNSTTFGAYFTSTANEGLPYDFSNGVIGNVVPEPGTVALLICGAGALLIALCRRRGFQFSALFVAATLPFGLSARAQAPPGSLWYNGDPDNVNGLANERNTLVTQAAVYDDFNVSSPLGWHVTSVLSHDLFSPDMSVTAADWEIRIGLSEGNAGTLVAGGTTNSPVVTNYYGTQNEFIVEVTQLNVFLPMLPSGQHYWLNVTPVGEGTGRSFNSTTSGTNCVGTPCGNDSNAFWNSSYFGAVFTSTSGQCTGCNDFSMGIIGTVVPEPATLALFACGVGAVLIARRYCVG
jgi:hypothetical protein